MTDVPSAATATRAGVRLPIAPARIGLVLAIVGLCLVAGWLSPGFLTPNNLLNVVRQASVVGVAAIGLTFVVLVRGVDVSVAGVITVVATIATGVMNGSDANIPLAVAVAIVLGLAIGTFNGLLASRGVHPFILTLGVGVALLGLTQLFTGGTSLGNPAPSFRSVLNARIGPVPVLAIVFFVLAGIAALVHGRTTFGRRIVLVGANPLAARLSGVSVNRYVILAYATSGLTAALAGLVLLARSGPPSNFTGMGLEFQALAAVILGGTSFAGGKGGVWGSVAGALAMALALNLVNILGLPFSAQQIVQGAVIILIAAAYAAVRKESAGD